MTRSEAMRERLLRAARYVAEGGTNDGVVSLREYQRNHENFPAAIDGDVTVTVSTAGYADMMLAEAL
jgi:hypothetical protein